MLWFVAAASVLAAGMMYCKKSAAPNCLMLCSGEDDDIKIAPEFPSRFPKADDGEAAALEFAEQKKKGNIQKAYVLGTRLASLLLTGDSLLNQLREKNVPAVSLNAQVLFAFAVDRALEEASAGELIAKTTVNFFYESLKMSDPVLYEQIILPEAFSLYLLSVRDSGSREEDGRIGYPFAKLCGREKNAELIDLGNRLYAHSMEVCRKQIEQVGFQ